MYSHTGEKSIFCKVCKFKISYKRIQTHMRSHIDLFFCDHCNFSSRYKCGLQVHLRQHVRGKCYACNLCNFTTAWKNSLLKHVRTHDGKKPFTCNSCSFTTVNKSRIEMHRSLHTDEKPCVCYFCDYTTNRKSYLKLHLQHLHRSSTLPGVARAPWRADSRTSSEVSGLKEVINSKFKDIIQGRRGNATSEDALKALLFERFKEIVQECSNQSVLGTLKSSFQGH